jgi:RNA polymerase II transcription elongation factor
MSVLSASITSSGGLPIDPTRQAEYPILLGDKLAKKQSTQGSNLINITYNHKSKSSTSQQQAKITRSSTSRDIYNLTIKDKAGNAEQTTLAYSYRGSIDPASPVSESDTGSLVLVFDPQRKAFILESISSHLNFNLRSARGKTDTQVKQYPQLSTLLEDDQPSCDDRLQGSASEGEGPGPADSSNPYDYRHFLPKANAERDKIALSTSSTPDPQSVLRKIPPLPAKSQPKPRPVPKARQPTDSTRQRKRVTGPSTSAKPPTVAKPAPKPASRVEDVPAESSHSEGEEDLGVTSNRLAPSPGSNIIIDGDLIIDMGSPPPSRPTFKVNPAHFSSNNTSGNESDAPGDDIDDIDDLRLPSPARHTGVSSDARVSHAPPEEEEEDDGEDNDSFAEEIVKEMEAAFEESEREQTQFQHQQHYSVQSEEESEVSEEE